MKHKAITAIIVAFTLTLLTPSQTRAWGGKGHLIVAHIASMLLNDNARAEVNELLAEGESLESVATWADDLRGSFQDPGIRPETPHWHFVDIPLNQPYDATRDCAEAPNGSCAISALVIFQSILAGKTKGYYSNSRYEALKFIVHFAGDIHQPLHCVNDDDFGGNTKKVVWIDQSILKLHGVWDDAILNENMRRQNLPFDQIKYAEFLFGTLTTAERKLAEAPSSTSSTVVSRSVIESWAGDAHTIANNAYSDIGVKDPQGRYNLKDGTYYNNHKKQVDDQLKLAGIRLARILNENLR